MKTTNKIILSKTYCVLSLLTLLGLQAFATDSPPCCLTFPAGTSLNASVTVYPNFSVPSGDPNPYHGFTTPPAWFAVDVADASQPQPIPSGIYPAWCVDESHFLPAVFSTIPGIPYSGTLISTCDSNGLKNLPAHDGNPPVGPPDTVTLATWHEINYILNHKGAYYWWNVQVAISRLVGGPAPNDPLNPTQPSENYPPVDPNEVNTILTDANANATSWTLPCGGTVGVIFVIPDLTTGEQGSDNPNYTGAVQLIMLEVPCTCPTASCVAITAVRGVAITPVTMTGSGGCGGPYTFSASGLPAGVTMSSSGMISGTPTVSGNVNYTVTVTDNCGNTGTVNCSVTVCGSSVCGTVYADCDGSGDLSGGDVGFANVVVTLKNAQGQVVATVKTDANGNYCFYNLPAGSYTVAIVQPSSCKQTGGTTTHHWKDNFGRTCWKDNDNYVHWKDNNKTDCWNANDGYMHWKDSYGRDCWKDRYGNNHSQNCNYVSCDARVDNTESVTLGHCEAKGDVDFAYMGTVPKTQVCISGPTRAKCGDTITYTCKVSNLGNVCFTGGCKVQICGQWFTCPNLSPGQDWTCTKNYSVQWGDFGTLNCNVTATCYPAGGGTVSDHSTCSTQVGWR